MHKASVALGTLLLTSVYCQGALIAHYDFADGDRYDNEVSAAFTLTETSNGTNVITTTPEGAVNFPGETWRRARLLSDSRAWRRRFIHCLHLVQNKHGESRRIPGDFQQPNSERSQ